MELSANTDVLFSVKHKRVELPPSLAIRLIASIGFGEIHER
jgi:hypothetical protein